MIQLSAYELVSGRRPFEVWLKGVKDRSVQARIMQRMRQVEEGNLGDHASVGDGVVELRLHFGPGYRVYCGRHGEQWIILLCGGDKSSQSKDIESAKNYWADWKRRTQCVE